MTGTLISVGGQIIENDNRVEPMTRLPGTDVLAGTALIACAASSAANITLCSAQEDRPDPLNPRRHVLPGGEDSFMPGGRIVSRVGVARRAPATLDYASPGCGRRGQPWSSTALPAACWVTSACYRCIPRLAINRPPGPYPLVVLLDRWAYAEAMAAPTTLDNLIAAGALPPVVAVMVSHINHTTRAREMLANPAFADCLAQELAPWVRQHYAVTPDPARTVIGGLSAGGRAAAYVAWRHPEVFGLVLSQSGAFQSAPAGDPEAEWLTRQLANSPRQPLSFYLEAGLLEVATDDPHQPSLLLANRHLRDVLHAKGYPVHYSEFCGAHLFGCWQGTFADGLLALLGGQAKEAERHG